MGQESIIQAEVVEFARSFRLIAKKMKDGEGWPDYMFLGGGRVLFIEFKAPGEHPSPAQREMMRILVSHGFTVRVVSSAEEGRGILLNFFSLEITWKRSSSTTGGTSPSSL